MTEAELVAEIEGENRGDDAVVDLERSAEEAIKEFADSVTRRFSVTTEAQLVDEIGGYAASVEMHPDEIRPGQRLRISHVDLPATSVVTVVRPARVNGWVCDQDGEQIWWPAKSLAHATIELIGDAA